MKKLVINYDIPNATLDILQGSLSKRDKERLEGFLAMNKHLLVINKHGHRYALLKDVIYIFRKNETLFGSTLSGWTVSRNEKNMVSLWKRLYHRMDLFFETVGRSIKLDKWDQAVEYVDNYV